MQARGTTGRRRRYFIMPYNVRALEGWEASEAGGGKGRNKRRGTGRTRVILVAFHSQGCVTGCNTGTWDLIGTSRVIQPSNIRSTMERSLISAASLRNIRRRLVPPLCRCRPSQTPSLAETCAAVCVMTRGTRRAFPLRFRGPLPSPASESHTHLFDLVSGLFPGALRDVPYFYLLIYLFLLH